jgi:hypothetical protein
MPELMKNSAPASGRLALAATWEAKEGEAEAVADILRSMARAVKSEPGTLLFWPHRSSANDHIFFLYELFAFTSCSPTRPPSPPINKPTTSRIWSSARRCPSSRGGSAFSSRRSRRTPTFSLRRHIPRARQRTAATTVGVSNCAERYPGRLLVLGFTRVGQDLPHCNPMVHDVRLGGDCDGRFAYGCPRTCPCPPAPSPERSSGGSKKVR